MFHLSAFYQLVDLAGVFTAINAVREEVLFTNGVDIRVPVGLPFVCGELALINDVTVLPRAELQSPSLRTQCNIDVEPIASAATPGNIPELNWHGANPIPLQPDEALNLFMLSDPAAPVVHYGLVYFADGPQQAAQGQVFSIRATSAVQQAVGAWTNGSLTFAQSLPAGQYAIVGMRARGTGLVAARLVFPDQTPRPGVPAALLTAGIDNMNLRFGNAGVFGTFPNTLPPTVDVLGGTAVAQQYVFDLIRLK